VSRDIAILGGLGLVYLAMFATILKVGWFLVKERRRPDPDATSFHSASAVNQASENEVSPAVTDYPQPRNPPSSVEPPLVLTGRNR
jgi:hypothetical protein